MTGNPEVMTSGEVKSRSSIDRFLVVFHSPTGMAETGLLACRSEKTGRAHWPLHCHWQFASLAAGSTIADALVV
jgi:hypothetical protein